MKMMIAQVSPSDVQKAADYAAQQSDRWLFVALLIVGLIALALLAKYFTTQHENLASKLDDTNRFVRDDLVKLVVGSTEAMQKNASAINDLRDALDESGARPRRDH